jgi:hypothetical protein
MSVAQLAAFGRFAKLMIAIFAGHRVIISSLNLIIVNFAVGGWDEK